MLSLLLALTPIPLPGNLGLVPKPLSLKVEGGTFTLPANAHISASKGLENEANFLRESLAPATGFKLAEGGKGTISLRLDPKLKELGPEGYRLQVRPDGVEIRSAGSAGVFYGVETLRQLLPPDSLRKAPVSGQSWTVPCVEIEDKPRFAWRGMHLDVCRHFMPKEFVMKYIDLLAFHKMNTFHWHLTDDQGWRLEIKRYPKLTSVGGWRKDSLIRFDPDVYTGRPHGGFYTQEDAREVVAYAAARHITVVPEIEMPGHAQAAIAAYPELGNYPDRQLDVWTRWGVTENIFNPDDNTLTFMKNVLDEVMAIFPSKFIHVGGDEAPKTQWKASPVAQAKMKTVGAKTEDELQSWFIHQMDAYISGKGRRLIGWDEILEGGLAPGATVMSWRGIDGGIAAAKAGHDVVMAPGSHTYFDHYQSRDTKNEPQSIGGYLPLSTVYSFEPVPDALTPEEAKHILGAQAQIWTEYIRTPKEVEYMAYPRACALAEILWDPKGPRDYAEFIDRLKVHTARLRVLDVAYRRLDP